MPAEAALTSDVPRLLRSDSDGIARLTLNRPRQYNALSAALMGELQAALDDIAADNAVRVVVIEGAGRGFCAGHDLKELRGRGGDTDFFQAIFKQCSRLMTTITAQIGRASGRERECPYVKRPVGAVTLKQKK